MNSLSDGFFIPGVRSTPNKLKNVSTTSAQTRSDDGKHVFDLHPQNGPSMAADGGKHVVSVSPTGGISVKTAMKLAIDATGGMDVKGATHFADAVTSAKSFDAPGGSVGGFGGLASGLMGALIGAGAMIALQAAQAPSPGVQQASFAQAVWVR